MKRICRAAILFSVVFVAEPLCCREPSFPVVGYLPQYRMATWSQETGPLTDLMYFGISVPENGEFASDEIPADHLTTLRKIKRRRKLRILLTVGGWNKSQGFPAMTSDADRRSRFILAARMFCQKNHFDGIDYDWEHPEGPEQMSAMVALLKETHREFAPHKLLVTMAQAGWQNFGQAAYDAVDRVHLMAYDHDFPQATMDKSRADVTRLAEYGCPKQKIILGLPFYGRNINGEPKTYAELTAAARAEIKGDDFKGYAFNGPATIAGKVRYARQSNLGGVMIWEIGQDSNGPRSLLKTIEREVKQERVQQ